MAEAVTQGNSTKASGGCLTVSLFAPGMTALHKVGLAGLWMTLEALERENGGKPQLAGLGSWERKPTSVTMRWDDDSRAFFKRLFQESFKIDKSGLVWFPALGAPMDNPQHAVVLQEALLGSFLQHGRTRKADPSQKPGGSVSFDIDGEPHPLKFHKFQSYSHQDGEFITGGPNTLAGWLYPGGVVRHTGLGQESTALEESPERALALRFAPAGAIYFEVRRRGGGVRPRYALVMAEIRDLQRYASARSIYLKYGVQQLYAAGASEAGFRVLAELEAGGMLSGVGVATCRVISFGTVPWSSQQKTRIGLITVRAGSEADLRTFNYCRTVLPPRLVRPKEGKGDAWWDIPQVPDLVATNLCQGGRWWAEFADFTADRERGDHVFNWEKGGLAQMVQDEDAFPEGAERTFVLACHEAWRRRVGQLGEKAQRQRSNFADLASREFDSARISFARCKNAASLREAVTDFWARAGGPIAPLQERWRDVLPLLGEERWRQGRDLALLALASYQARTKDERDAANAVDSALEQEEKR